MGCLYHWEECNRASAHATCGGERGERGGESSYYNLHYHLEAFLAAADYTGTVSGAKTDKSAIFPYHLGDAGMPIIEQSPLVMECEVIDTYVIDGFKNYICTILNTYIEEDMLDEKDKPDYAKLKPVLFEMPTYKYLRTGDIIGDCVKMDKAAIQREESDACISSSEQ